jgi:hypothetical protein
MSDSPSTPKKAFPLRISPRLFEQLRVWADEELRSINGQIEYVLADAVRRRRGKPPGVESADGLANPSDPSDPSD